KSQIGFISDSIISCPVNYGFVEGKNGICFFPQMRWDFFNSRIETDTQKRRFLLDLLKERKFIHNAEVLAKIEKATAFHYRGPLLSFNDCYRRSMTSTSGCFWVSKIKWLSGRFAWVLISLIL